MSTIAAISTALGNSGISVIRMSGPDSISIAEKVFKSINNKKLSEMKGYTAAFGHVYENDEKIDECICTVFRNPNSYTGEDVVELSCHGGIVIAKIVLRILVENGASFAEPGEFTKRAFLNNKMDLAQAESVMDLISARNKYSMKAALDIKDGALSKEINLVKENLLNSASHLSAWADYPEEDIMAVDTENLKKDLEEQKEKLIKISKSYDQGKIIKNGLNTAIVGKPNVGKSTLMNLLSKSDKSIVTEIPGTTRDIVEEEVNIGNVTLNLSDTAGIRESDDVVEKIGVERAIDRIEKASLILALFDNSSELSDDDKTILNNIKDKDAIVLINKTDLENKLDENEFSSFKYVIKISAKENLGIEELIKAVEEISGLNKIDLNDSLIYSERQKDLVEKAIKAIDDSINAINIGMTNDAITVSIEDAISYLLELTGERVTEKVVDKVFHNFCVGK